MKPDLQIQTQLDWFELHGVARFDLAVQRHTGLWMQQNPGMDRASLQRHFGWCRSENAHGSYVYFRAERDGCWPVVFVDDVATDDAQRIAQTHPTLVVETSPDRCHVWIVSDEDLDERQRFVLQKHLAATPGANGTLADAASVSGDHWGRLAGFRNRKPSRDCWVNLVRASHDLPALPASAVLAETPHAPISPTTGGSVVICPASPADRRASSESEREWAAVMVRLERGESPSEVESWLTERAGPRRGVDAARYAHHTVAKAYRTVVARRVSSPPASP